MDLKRLTEKKGKFTKTEKEWLVEQGAIYGVPEPANTNCPDCWRDMAIRVAVAMRPKEAKNGTRLKGMAADNGVIFKGRLITNDILDDALLSWMRDNGFPEKLLEDAEG